MWSSYRPLVLVVAITAAQGCANVKVKKVPVEDRIAGKDHHVKGFRYYVSRPYMVVKQRVPVMTRSWHAELVRATSTADKKSEYLLYGLEPGASEYALYDRTTGNRHDRKPSDYELVLVTNSMPAASPQPADPKKTDGGGNAAPPGQAGNSGGGGDSPPTPRPATPSPRDAAPAAPRPNGPPGSPGNPVQDPSPKKQATVPTNPGLMSGTFAPRDGDDSGTPASVYDAIQVVNLPDFEEQLAIKNKNFAAEGKYDLHFTDGWSLDSMTGEWNATQVPVRVLQSIQNAIGAVSAYEQKAIPATKPATPPKDSVLRLTDGARGIVFEITREYAIEPGIYRVQKSWERLPPGPPSPVLEQAALGLLKDLGLPLVESCHVHPK